MKTFGSAVADHVITGVDVSLKNWCQRVTNVIHHHTTYALQSNEGIGLGAKLADHHTFGFWALGRATVFQRIVVIASIESDVNQIFGDLFELVTRVEYKLQLVIPDRERSAAK